MFIPVNCHHDPKKSAKSHFIIRTLTGRKTTQLKRESKVTPLSLFFLKMGLPFKYCLNALQFDIILY